MKSTIFGAAIIGVGALFEIAGAAEIVVKSGPDRTHLMELFTSEGCSSCPPAEKWFSSLKENPRLWKDIVPVAFHVDYWDSLGWPDQFASRAYSDRQRAYSAVWKTPSVYTPEFVLDGAEWRGRNLEDIQASKGEAGKLAAILKESGEVTFNYEPASGYSGKWEAHAALLSLGVSVDVKRGENAGRKLVHDFVVVSHVTAVMGKDRGVTSVILNLPAEKIIHEQSALAVWVTQAGKITPIQSAGGPL